jgi:hypothetical protein
MSSAKGEPAEALEGAPPKKKVKFSSQVSVQEFHAHPAAETVVFHLLYSTTPSELEQEMAKGGQPFNCEFYNQVGLGLSTCLQEVCWHGMHSISKPACCLHAALLPEL